MVTAANFFADKAVLPPLIPPQLATSREHSLDRFPTISMRSSSWKELLDRMLLPPNPNVLSCHTGKNHAMLTLCSFTSGVPEALGAAGRYQHDNVTARTPNRQYTTTSGRYECAYKIFSNRRCSTGTHTAAESKRFEILKWISSIPYTSHHRRICEGRLEGTGEWLFKREEYRTWRSSSASKLLLLRGIRMSSRDFFMFVEMSFSLLPV